jgi:hypothetical protein
VETREEGKREPRRSNPYDRRPVDAARLRSARENGGEGTLHQPVLEAEDGADPAWGSHDSPRLGETLEQIVVINAEGLLIVQTIWARPANRGRGRRVTHTETVAGEALMQRLGQLLPALCRPRDALRAVSR